MLSAAVWRLIRSHLNADRRPQDESAICLPRREDPLSATYGWHGPAPLPGIAFFHALGFELISGEVGYFWSLRRTSDKSHVPLHHSYGMHFGFARRQSRFKSSPPVSIRDSYSSYFPCNGSAVLRLFAFLNKGNQLLLRKGSDVARLHAP